MMSISRYDVYLSRMEKSMYDKLFFVDKIFDDKIDTFFDFGCANGTLIQYVHNFMPNLKYVGYDINPTMCEEARKNVPYAEFYSNWEDAFARVNPDTCILNLSSVIHEVYSYETAKGIEQFWDRLCNTGWAYIVVRDMTKIDLWYSAWGEIEALKDIAEQLDHNPTYGDLWRDFKGYWGDKPTQVMHFFMKYRYKENWSREVMENYIPMTAEMFEARLYSGNEKYDCIYRNVYTLPFIRHQVEKDFGYDLTNLPTHMQFIFKNNS